MEPPTVRSQVNSDRLSQLRELLREDPEDRFLRYAIALELKRAGDMDAAAADLEDLLSVIRQTRKGTVHYQPLPSRK